MQQPHRGTSINGDNHSKSYIYTVMVFKLYSKEQFISVCLLKTLMRLALSQHMKHNLREIDNNRVWTIKNCKNLKNEHLQDNQCYSSSKSTTFGVT